MRRRDLLKAFAATVSSAGITEVQIGEIPPGAIIVLKHPGNPSQQEFERLKQEAAAIFGNRKIVILTGGLSIEVLKEK